MALNDWDEALTARHAEDRSPLAILGSLGYVIRAGHVTYPHLSNLGTRITFSQPEVAS